MTWLIPLSTPDCLQAREFAEAAGRTTCTGYGVAPISAAALAELAPGMCPNALAAAAQGDGRGAGLLVQGGLVLHPERYVRCEPLPHSLVCWTGGLGTRVALGVCVVRLPAVAARGGVAVAVHKAGRRLIRVFTSANALHIS